ncbi:MAG: hypothetical protein ACTS3F_04470 [Phycisphaerales bacterium]
MPNDIRECYCIFLDILGFRQLVKKSMADHATLEKIVALFSTLDTLRLVDVKNTSLGECPIQIRTLSDSIVLFSPCNANDATTHPNPLAQLLFVARYIHDRAVRIGYCIRGGIAKGHMYWPTSYGNGHQQPDPKPHFIFGTALNTAYDLESKSAFFPRIVVDESVIKSIARMRAYPLAGPEYDEDLLIDYFTNDGDGGVRFVDMLHRNVNRSSSECIDSDNQTMSIPIDGNGRSRAHQDIVRQCIEIASCHLRGNFEPGIHCKHIWLKQHAESRQQ